jgi:hypothetical protein
MRLRSFSSVIVIVAFLATARPCFSQPVIGGCQMFPANNVWNQPIDKAPLHPNSDAWKKSIGSDKNLHPDFGTETAIPITIVGRDQPLVKVVTGNTESDLGPMPIPLDAPKEKGSDQHVVVLRQGDCRLFELFDAKPYSEGGKQIGWEAGSIAAFDLNSNTLRPDGWTSADAAGLPILPGLLRFEDLASGELKHPIRFTVPKTTRAYVWPARHYASRIDDAKFPPMGARFRLKADFDGSRFSPLIQVLIKGLKTYGIILADNGAPWFLTGAPHPKWDESLIAEVKKIPAAAFEAVDVSGWQIASNSGLAKMPPAPGEREISFSAQPTFDFSTATLLRMTLSGDVTAAKFEGFENGQLVSVLLCQDAVGNHSFQWPNSVKGGMLIGKAPGKCSAQAFVVSTGGLTAVSPGIKDM